MFGFVQITAGKLECNHRTSRIKVWPIFGPNFATNRQTYFKTPQTMDTDLMEIWGFTKSRTAAHGPRRPSGQWPATAQRPVAHGPRRPSGPAARSRFSNVFCPAVNPCACTVCNGFGRAKWRTASLNSFTSIILHNHFNTFIRCMLLREKCFHSPFIRPFTKPEREDFHSQRCKLFSIHSLRMKISY